MELPAETVIDTESEGGQVNANDDVQDDYEECYGDAEYSPMDNSDDFTVAEYGDDDFAVCRKPNSNFRFTYLRTIIEAIVTAIVEAF